MTPNEIVTKSDLEKLKEGIITAMQEMLSNDGKQKKWLKSSEVRKMLGISSGTLQQLRINGTLPYSKIGGMIFYQWESIEKMLKEGESRL